MLIFEYIKTQSYGEYGTYERDIGTCVSSRYNTWDKTSKGNINMSDIKRGIVLKTAIESYTRF
jgi:hypothetical protein